MTLYRQVLMLLLVTLLVSFVTVMGLNLRSNADYLEQQLRASTDSVATSLGMRIAPFLNPYDPVLTESTVTAAFDGSFLKRIDIEFFADNSHLTKTKPELTQGVPQWFVSLFEMAPVVTQAPLTSGWVEVAMLTVEGHPGNLYRQLWQLATNLVLIYGALFIVLAVFTSIGLRWVTRPLEHIELQAEAIKEKDFDYRIPLPRARELKRVVETLNHLTGILKKRFFETAKQLEVLQDRLLIDADSGLLTRRAVLDIALGYMESGQPGTLLLIRIEHLEALRQHRGFRSWRQVVDALSSHAADQFEQQRTDYSLGRLSSQDFALLLSSPVKSETKLQQLVDALNGDLAAIEEELQLTLVAAEISADVSVGEVLTQLDDELRSCLLKNRSCALLPSLLPENSVRTAEEWLLFLKDRLAQQALHLRKQPVITHHGGQMHQEVFASLLDNEGHSLHAGLFIPVIEQFELGAMLDLAVLHKALDKSDDIPVAINLSLSTMRDTGFISALTKLPALQRQQVLFEVSEINLNREFDTVLSFANVIRQLGFSIGIDQVGASGRSLDYLQSLRPAYVKAAPGLSLTDSDSIALLESLTNTVNNLGIPVIATAVEEQAQADRLWQIGIAGLQGFFTDQ
ncbi:bifunctional diguanylate cyclase/phosphodiesterase [Reinekea marinisedimentorum]|uniref:EAL domain-containing protein (Putative c-di-GMP-specific phosphodiesterase class I) n=1 Tax=Reinekea marinisedimentorum TaxID=230495 RepID=A0A4R3HT67_9GAMM|nr:EAL domain-containing protein [Reinekea marinisedimentorum]TCS36168.1 EAL domain-containing protein (putative c-di-GMP-specific phosphodiesterase class I) [Reinekea marinisedimentorum]